MFLDARQRSSNYQKLVPLFGDDDTNAFMTAFPQAEGDELVTKDFLRAELAEMRSEIVALEARLTMRLGAMAAATIASMSALKLFA